mgnify:FL=1
MKLVRPKEGVGIYHAASGHDFALADLDVLSFSEKVRGVLTGEPRRPVLAVIVRHMEQESWYELSSFPRMPNLCVDDIHAMALLWREFQDETPSTPRCYQ